MSFDPIETISNRRIDLVWDNTYPEPVRFFPADNVAFAHTGHTTASLRAALAQVITVADVANPSEALDYAAHLLMPGSDLAYACAHHRDPFYAARSLGVTLAMFERRVHMLNRQGRNQVRLAAARSLCSRCRVRQEPLALTI